MRRGLLLALLSCAHVAPRAPPGYGLSRENAVEVCLPTGVQAYLKALRCPGGAPPDAHRIGSVGPRSAMVDPNDPRLLEQMDPGHPLAPGEPDLHVVDAFELTCAANTQTVYIDMYHCPSARPFAPDGLHLEQ